MGYRWWWCGGERVMGARMYYRWWWWGGQVGGGGGCGLQVVVPEWAGGGRCCGLQVVVCPFVFYLLTATFSKTIFFSISVIFNVYSYILNNCMTHMFHIILLCYTCVYIYIIIIILRTSRLPLPLPLQAMAAPTSLVEEVA